jgi:hypothetical protein
MLDPVVAEKNPGTVEGSKDVRDGVTPILALTLPVPRIEGISKKLTGMRFEALTMFNRTLSLAYPSSTSR